MAKTKVIKRRARKHWAPCINKLQNSIQLANTAGDFYFFSVLATNPQQATNNISRPIVVKNCEFTYKIDCTNAARVNDVQIYMMYVPEGHQITDNLPYQHPEWILAYSFQGAPDGPGPDYSVSSPKKIRTRLARRLQTGDNVILLVNGFSNHTESNPITLSIKGLARYWTHAN